MQIATELAGNSKKFSLLTADEAGQINFNLLKMTKKNIKLVSFELPNGSMGIKNYSFNCCYLFLYDVYMIYQMDM